MKNINNKFQEKNHFENQKDKISGKTRGQNQRYQIDKPDFFDSFFVKLYSFIETNIKLIYLFIINLYYQMLTKANFCRILLTYILVIYGIIQINFANVTPFDPSTISLIMKEKIPAIFLITSSSANRQELIDSEPIVKNGRNQKKENALFQFHKAAQVYYQLFPQKSPEFRKQKNAQQILLFVLSDSHDGLYTFQKLSQYLGVYQQQTPTIFFLSHQHLKYKFNQQKINSQSIMLFLSQISKKQIPIYYKSQPISYLQIEERKNKIVKPLIGRNFYESIYSEDKQFFILFYIPFNFKSRVLKVQFEKAAQSLRNNKNILFRKVNGMKNQIVYNVKYRNNQQKLQKIIVQNDPVIRFWPKDKKQKPIQFHIIRQYEGTYDYMIKWLKKMTSYQWVKPEKVSQDFVEQL